MGKQLSSTTLEGYLKAVQDHKRGGIDLKSDITPRMLFFVCNSCV